MPSCWRSFCASASGAKAPSIWPASYWPNSTATWRCWRQRRSRNSPKISGIGPAKASQLAATLELARRALSGEMVQRDVLGSPESVRQWLRLKLGTLGHEVFVALWLDAQNRLIEYEEMFRGTLTQTSVYPREIVKRALACNAAGVLFAHNHPSGVAEPSRADEALTQALKQALLLIDVKVLDHFVIAGNTTVSFAKRGLL
jgi:DNA repair protein RadC